jgi:hypothetical protein
MTPSFEERVAMCLDMLPRSVSSILKKRLRYLRKYYDGIWNEELKKVPNRLGELVEEAYNNDEDKAEAARRKVGKKQEVAKEQEAIRNATDGGDDNANEADNHG